MFIRRARLKEMGLALIYFVSISNTNFLIT